MEKTNQEVQYITFKDVKYDASSITEKGKALITDISKIESKVDMLQFEINVFNATKSMLIKELEDETSEFKKIEDE